MSNKKILEFYGYKLEATYINGKPWFGGKQLGEMLGYESHRLNKGVATALSALRDEVTEDMVMEFTEPSISNRRIILYSPKAVNLLIMKCNTKRTKIMRCMMLDVLGLKIERPWYKRVL